MDDIERSWAKAVVLMTVAQCVINAILLWGFHFRWGWLVTMLMWMPLSVWIGVQHGRMRRNHERELRK